jgi:predicted amidohydrolase YtcJ
MFLLRTAQVAGRLVDVAVEGNRVAAIDEAGSLPGASDEIDARQCALLPGLHDHHVHLLALAAARRSLQVGPPAVRTEAALAMAIRAAGHARPPGEWLRGVGYHESVAGNLDRDDLDRMAAHYPVRIQHRSGAMWMLNSAAIELLGLDGVSHAGIERDAAGRPTGRLYGMDDWLRDRWRGPPPDLAAVGAELLRYGITGVTDATATTRAEDAELLAGAVASGAIPQRVQLTGGLDLDPGAGPSLPRGPVKLMVADHDLPGLDDLAASIAAAHRRARPVALHCVTRVALVLAQAAWDRAGVAKGDRVEHGAVVPPDQAGWLAQRGIVVVTQPIFVADRGDQYLTDVDAEDLPYLWPCRSLVEAGVRVAASSDAPLGHPDPWAGMAAAVTRQTAGGRVLGPEERLTDRAARDLYLAPLDSPGGPPRRVAMGVDADLVLLDVPLRDALREPSAEHVMITFRAGRAHSAIDSHDR